MKNPLSIFFEDAPEEKKDAVPTVQPVTAPTSPVTQPVWTTTGTVTPSNQVPTSSNEIAKFMQYFEGLFDKSNLPGPDYYEFIKMHQAMPSVLTDDQKIQAAFAGVSAQGLTKEQLVITAQKYIDIIDEDSKKFMAAIDTKALGEINKLKRQYPK